jgi:diguanylate cyclase (GGDEF)-like protein
VKSVRFGLLAIAICGVMAVAAGLQVVIGHRQLAALDAREAALTAQFVEIRNAMEALLDIETGQRGYLLTGEEVFLAPHQKGLQAIGLAISRLTLHFRDDAHLLAELDIVVDLARAAQDHSTRVIALRRSGAAEQALAIVKTGEGKRLMDDFREKVAMLEGRLVGALFQLRAEESRMYDRASMLVAFAAAMLLVVVAGAIGWLSISIRRLDELQHQREREAMHDALTGLPNRRYLREWLGHALAAAQRSGRPLAVAYFDLDGFKSVNDRFGHEAGDRVLQVTAARLRGAARASDFVARLGGDEFVAVLTEVPPWPGLSSFIERLAEGLAKAPIPEIADGAVFASVGVAVYPDDGESADALLTAADRAMYAVKERRRAERLPRIPQPDRTGTPAAALSF